MTKWFYNCSFKHYYKHIFLEQKDTEKDRLRKGKSHPSYAIYSIWLTGHLKQKTSGLNTLI